VLFVKQQSDFYSVRDSGWNLFEMQMLEYAIKIESLLEHGFDVIQCWTPHWEAKDGRTKDFGEMNGRTLTIIDDIIEWQCLKFESSVKLARDTDSFIIVLSGEHPASEGVTSVGITSQTTEIHLYLNPLSIGIPHRTGHLRW
jgi:hypothetical protein